MVPSPLLVLKFASHQLSFHLFSKDGYDEAACGISLNGISFNGISALRLVSMIGWDLNLIVLD